MVKKVEIVTLFRIMFFVYLVIFLKLRFKIDLNGLLSLVLIFVITFLRLVAAFVIIDKTGTSILLLVQIPLLVAFWYSLYYYIVEMFRVKMVIESQSPQLYQISSRIISRIHKFLVIFYISAAIIKEPCDFTRLYHKSVYDEYVIYIDYILCTVKLIIDVIMHSVFIYLFVFFLKFKAQRNPI